MSDEEKAEVCVTTVSPDVFSYTFNSRILAFCDCKEGYESPAGSKLQYTVKLLDFSE